MSTHKSSVFTIKYMRLFLVFSISLILSFTPISSSISTRPNNSSILFRSILIFSLDKVNLSLYSKTDLNISLSFSVNPLDGFTKSSFDASRKSFKRGASAGAENPAPAPSRPSRSSEKERNRGPGESAPPRSSGTGPTVSRVEG